MRRREFFKLASGILVPWEPERVYSFPVARAAASVATLIVMGTDGRELARQTITLTGEESVASASFQANASGIIGETLLMAGGILWAVPMAWSAPELHAEQQIVMSRFTLAQPG